MGLLTTNSCSQKKSTCRSSQYTHAKVLPIATLNTRVNRLMLSPSVKAPYFLGQNNLDTIASRVSTRDSSKGEHM